MNEHWIRYKDNIINIARLNSFRVERWRKRSKDEGMVSVYTGDLEPSKEKPYMLWAGHEGLDTFKTKTEAFKVATDIIKGVYDI